MRTGEKVKTLIRMNSYFNGYKGDIGALCRR